LLPITQNVLLLFTTKPLVGIFKPKGAMEYWFIQTGEDAQPGINGGIMRHDGQMPNVINTIGVESIDASLETVVKSGGQIAQPKFNVPGRGYLAYIVDTEGNLFGLMQYDSSVS
jgi:uncharacterized protein